jgi:hypothetical protein
MKKKDIIFLLPYLHVNTTSAERFKSFISAFISDKRCRLSVIVIQYPSRKSFFPGFGLKVDSLMEITTLNYKAQLNFIQKTGFYFLERDFIKLWKICKLLQLIFFRTDIFHPGNLSELTNQFIKNEGSIIISGGPFSFFYPAYLLSKKLNYQLIVDYRDPQTFGYIPLDGFSFIYRLRMWLERGREITVIKNTFLISTVSNSLKQFFPKEYHKKINIFPNGSNFLHKNVIKISPIDKFNIVYAGTIYDDQLKNDDFFSAFRSFIEGRNCSKISLQFVGSNQNPKLKEKILEYKLEHYTEITPRLKKIKLLKYLNNASVFLHLKYGDKKDIISSKQAEYLMFRRPILLPVSDEGDLKESILSNNAGYVCYKKDDILKSLELLWSKFLNKENLFIEQPSEFIENLSREKIAEKFVKQILEFES